MKKLCLLLFIAFSIITAVHAQTGWVNYKFDNKLSVNLPSQPQKYGDNSQRAATKDSTVCIISLINLKSAMQMDSTAVAALLPTPDFAGFMKVSMFGKMDGFVMGDVKTGKWNGNYSYAIEGANASKKVKTYTFIVVIGYQLYALNCLVPDGNNIKDKDNFFVSFKLN